MITKQFAIAILIDFPYGHHWRMPTARYALRETFIYIYVFLGVLACGGVYVLRTRTRRTQRTHSRVAKGG
jgi:hypothetical protein